MPRAILIITGEYDATADVMVLHLRKRGVRFERFHTKDFPAQSRMGLRLGPGVPHAGGIEGPGIAFQWKDIGSIWYRRPEPYFVPGELSAEEKEFAELECGAALYGVWRMHDALWVNHPDANRRAESKALQLSIAQRLGLDIPKTLFTNDPAQLVQFYEESGGNIIYKAMTQAVLGRDSWRTVYTSRVTPQHLTQAHLLTRAPGLFQERIAKASDLRLTVIGERIFAAEIHGTPEERDNLDYRRADIAKLRHTSHALPPEVEQGCLALTRELDLQYAAIDLLLTPDGRYVFLEVNPNGEFGWIESFTDFPLTEALADLLIDGAARTERAAEETGSLFA